MDELEPQKSGISRRTVTKAMAWAVPAIAVAAPAPAFAISGSPPTVLIGTACKLPGNSQDVKCGEVYAGCPGLDTDKAYAFPIRITNTDDQVIYITDVAIISNPEVSDLAFDVKCISPAFCEPIAGGATVDILVYANSNDSANTTAEISISLTWGHSVDTTAGCTLTDFDHGPVTEGPVLITAFPPCSSQIPFPTGPKVCDPPFYQ